MVPLLFGALLWVLLQRASMSSVVETVVLSTLVCAPSVFCRCGRRVPRLLGMTLLAVYAWVGLTLVVVMNIHWPVAGPFLGARLTLAVCDHNFQKCVVYGRSYSAVN